MKTKLSLTLLGLVSCIGLSAQIEGEYTIIEKCTETNSGYTPSVPTERNIVITKIEGNIFGITGIVDFETLRAEATKEGTTFQIPQQVFENYDETPLYIQGKGVMTQGGIELDYSAGGSMGVMECKCIDARKRINHFPTSADKPLWAYYTSGTENGIPVIPTISFYGMIGDSLIQGQTFSKLYSLKDSTLEESSVVRYEGALRNEGKQVFYCPVGIEEKVLLYDFSIELEEEQERDLFCAPLFEYNQDILRQQCRISSSHQTIDIRNLPYKVFDVSFDDYGSVGRWIENIGGIADLIDYCQLEPDCICPTTKLVCLKLGDEELYQYEGKSLKTYVESTKTAIEEFATNPAISPNPVSDILYINTANGNPECSIVNTNGAVVWKGRAENNQINVSPLPAGVYSLKIENGGTHRFVKN